MNVLCSRLLRHLLSDCAIGHGLGRERRERGECHGGSCQRIPMSIELVPPSRSLFLLNVNYNILILIIIINNY